MASTPLFAEVAFEGGSLARGVRSVRTIETEYGHERAVVLVEDGTPSSKRFVSGAPVAIRWGREPAAVRTFVGYVDHVEPQRSPAMERDGEALLKVVCVAPSWAAKNEGYRTYHNVVATDVVKDIGTALRFDTSRVARSDRLFDGLHQSGKSDWAFMVECAQRAGWTLFARGVALYCLDRRTLINESAQRAPMLVSSAQGGTVSDFKPVIGATTPRGGTLAQRGGYSVNPRTGAVLASGPGPRLEKTLFSTRPTDPVFRAARTGVAFDSLAEAQADFSAEDRLNRLSITATLTGQSNPRARVGTVVAVLGFGDSSDGYWYVTDAEHEIKAQNRGTMWLTLGRDSTMPALTASPPLSTNTPARKPRLLSGRWVA